jgi:D-alanine-D-alanine ligase
MSRHVAVLLGGMSPEREVSLVSGAACAEALERAGHRVSRIDADRELAGHLTELRPDVAFNALHGRYGEDGCVQGLLELMRIPYTHSGVLASALAMDKPMALTLFRAAGLRCPDGVTLPLEDALAGDPIPRPYVVKPVAGGSSVGVHIVHPGEDSPLRGLNDPPLGAMVLVEPFVAGKELTVAVLGDRPLAVTEIRPREGFYDYRAKYTEGVADHVIPAEIPEAVYGQALEAALAAHRALGCRGVSRADFRFDPERGEDGLFLLEVNTQPGMTPLSLVPEQAAHCGIGFDRLVQGLLEEARCDT